MCNNYLCNEIKCYILFGIEDENDQHLLTTLTYNVIKFKKGIVIPVSKRVDKKAWKIKVKPEINRWSSEFEIKDIIKQTFKDFDLLFPQSYIK